MKELIKKNLKSFIENEISETKGAISNEHNKGESLHSVNIVFLHKYIEVLNRLVQSIDMFVDSSLSGKQNKIYIHDEATILVGLFEEVLSRYNIHVPSPEDDERDEEDMVGLYGSVYSELLDAVEYKVCELLNKHTINASVIEDVYSGNI